MTDERSMAFGRARARRAAIDGQGAAAHKRARAGHSTRGAAAERSSSIDQDVTPEGTPGQGRSLRGARAQGTHAPLRARGRRRGDVETSSADRGGNDGGGAMGVRCVGTHDLTSVSAHVTTTRQQPESYGPAPTSSALESARLQRQRAQRTRTGRRRRAHGARVGEATSARRGARHAAKRGRAWAGRRRAGHGTRSFQVRSFQATAGRQFPLGRWLPMVADSWKTDEAGRDRAFPARPPRPPALTAGEVARSASPH